MYTLQTAAAILHTSQETIKRWIAQANVQTTTIETDKKRRYISHKDLLSLAVKHHRKVGNLNKMTNRRSSERPEQRLYSLAEVAKYMDVSINTVSGWIAQCNIEKRYVTTDRKRAYITFFDLATLVHQHVRLMKSGTVKKDLRAQTDQDLCTLEEAAEYLGVSKDTVSGWLNQCNIEKESLEFDKRRVYIHQSDIIRLANLHPKESITKDFCTVREAAAYLGVSRRTVNKWLAQSNITPHIIGTTSLRVYIHYTDIIRLEVLHRKEEPDKDFCTVREAAAYLGVSKHTILRWLARCEITPKIIGTTGQRIYIRYADVIRLEEQYSRKPSGKDYCTIREAAEYFRVCKSTVLNWLAQSEISPRVVGIACPRFYIHSSDIARLEDLYPRKPSREDFCTLREAVQQLGVSRPTVLKWLKRSGISPQVSAPGQCLYISRSDVDMLAQQYKLRRRRGACDTE